MFTRPICFFDLETTDANVATARIIDIGIIKVHNLGAADERTETFEALVNPGCKITNSHIHGITDEMVAGEKSFGLIADAVWAFIDGCDLAGYNVKTFDIPLLAEEFYRNSKYALTVGGINVFDQLAIYRKLNPGNLSAVYKKYTGKELDGAHRSIADTAASLEIFKKMLSTDLADNTPQQILELQNGKENSHVDLAGKFYRKDGVIYFAFGQHKDKPAISQMKYLEWMAVADFTGETKAWVRKIYYGEVGERSKPTP